VRAAVEVLGAERMGTACGPIEDPAVVELLAERRVPLEISRLEPADGRRAGRRRSPLGALDAAGCIVTIDADRPGLFGTTLVDEYRYWRRRS